MTRVQPSCTREDLDEQWSHMEAMAPTEGTAETAPLLQFEESHFEEHCQPGVDEQKISVVV